MLFHFTYYKFSYSLDPFRIQWITPAYIMFSLAYLSQTPQFLCCVCCSSLSSLRSVRNFLFLTCSTCTRLLRLPQMTPHMITTSHTQGNHSLPHHPTTTFPFSTTITMTTEYHQSLQPTNPHSHYNTNIPNHQYLKKSTQPDWNSWPLVRRSRPPRSYQSRTLWYNS